MLRLLAGAARFLASPTPAFVSPLTDDHCVVADPRDPAAAATAPSGTTTGGGDGGGGVFFVTCLASASLGASAVGARTPQQGSAAVIDALSRQFNQLQVAATTTIVCCVVNRC